MKILLPFKRDLNPYLDELVGSSSHTFTYEDYRNYNDSYDIVNVHWPEAIFNWKEPSEEQLKDLEQVIDSWKKSSVLIYTKHDFQRNKGTTPNFSRLFELIERKADVFVHLGKFSQQFYEQKYPDAIHKVIYHPLYINSFTIPQKEIARKQLGINKEAFVVIVPGNIRSYAERDMVLKSFKSLNIKNKVLICTNVHSEIRYDFPGRIRLKRVVDIKKRLVNRFRNKYQPPEYIFSYNFIPREELELKMAAADVVLVPRINALNSGIVFLGLTFKKIIVGPECGNIKEQLKELGYPLFKAGKSIEVARALKEASRMGGTAMNLKNKKLSKYQPKNIIQEMDSFFEYIVSL